MIKLMIKTAFMAVIFFTGYALGKNPEACKSILKQSKEICLEFKKRIC